MRRFLATMWNCAARLKPGLLALALLPVSTGAVRSDSLAPEASAPKAASTCSAHEAAHHVDAAAASEPGCAAVARTPAEIAEARAYVVETATPGYTMTRQGPELATERLHPEFVVRLANAIREARNAGLSSAGVFSAYRPPAFGIGGFSDKFNSLHTYGLAVDMTGIGGPGSAEARQWHEIAARNGVVCPYGPRNQAEWNHCQPTSLKIVSAANPLRETVTAAGPADLDEMFEAGNRLIASMASAGNSLFQAVSAAARKLDAPAKGRESSGEDVADRRTKRHVRQAKAEDGKRHSRQAKAEEGRKTRHAKAEEGKRRVRHAKADEGQGRRKSKSG